MSDRVDELLARVRAGESIGVRAHLLLYPETRPERSVVRARADGALEHATYFHEFWAGHGWSIELCEAEPIDEARARVLLAETLAE